MHRNTYIVVTALAVFTALVVGVNIGRWVGNAPQPASQPTPTVTPMPTTAPPVSYTNPDCKVAFNYPAFLKKIDGTPKSALFVDPGEKNQSIALTCQKDIPRPALPPDKIETIQIGSISAKLYHDASPKDGTPIDALIFRHPKTKEDVFLSGLGDAFGQIVATLSILP